MFRVTGTGCPLKSVFSKNLSHLSTYLIKGTGIGNKKIQNFQAKYGGIS